MTFFNDKLDNLNKQNKMNTNLLKYVAVTIKDNIALLKLSILFIKTLLALFYEFLAPSLSLSFFNKNKRIK